MRIKLASDGIHPCHLQKFGYASGHVFGVAIVFPNFLRQQTSHIQQVHPTGGGLNSFGLPIHKWVPLLLRYEVLPQGKYLTRLTGSDFLIQCIPAIRHLCRRTPSRIVALEVSGSLCRFRAGYICTEPCAVVIHSARQQRIINTDYFAAHCNHCLHSL